MAQVSGQVSQIKEKQTQYGSMYDVVMGGQSYGLGKYPPRDIKQGDFVTLDFEQKGNFKNVVKGSLRKDDNPPAQSSTPTSSQASAGYAGKSTYVAFDERQEMISKQSALNTALTFCRLASDNGAVPMPASVKPADKLGLIHKWVLDTAASLYALSTGREWVLPEVDPATISKPQAKAKAASSEAISDDEYAE